MDLSLQSELPVCGRCGGEGVLSARIPLSRVEEYGEPAAGYCDAVLCPQCDREAPEAVLLLLLFAVDDRISGDNAALFTELARTWAEQVRAARLAELDRAS